MNIKSINKATILAALYNRAQPLGHGFLHYDPVSMTVEKAKDIITDRGDDHVAMFGPQVRANRLYFDYLKGRVMKVDLSKDDLDTRLYNRDNGDNAAEERHPQGTRNPDPP